MVSKKIKSIMMGALLVSAPLSLVFAEDTNETSDIQDQIVPVNDTVLFSNYGTEVRVAQLERRLEIQIENANQIINYSHENGYELNYTELDRIVDDLIDLENMIENLDLDNEEADFLREAFIDAQKEAIQLSNEFKSIVHEKINPEDTEELRNEIKANIKTKLGENNAKIEKYANQHNEQKMRAMGGMFNIDEETYQKVRNGEFNGTQAQNMLMEKYQNMGEDEKMNIRQKMTNFKNNARNNLSNKGVNQMNGSQNGTGVPQGDGTGTPLNTQGGRRNFQE